LEEWTLLSEEAQGYDVEWLSTLYWTLNSSFSTNWVGIDGNELYVLSPESANPFVSFLLQEDDDWAPGDILFTQLPSSRAGPLGQDLDSIPAICKSGDLARLRQTVMAPVSGMLAGKPLLHLDVWEATRGGAEFMHRRVLGYWGVLATGRDRSPQAAPETIGRWNGGGGTQRLSFLHLPGAYSTQEGREWRLVWDGRAINAEQLSMHFRMEGAETVQRIMLKGD
jgi:hypothetical protein